MAATSSQHLFFFLLSLFAFSSGDLVLAFTRGGLLSSFLAVQHDLVNQPYTGNPTTPVTNPVTTPVTNPVTTPATTAGGYPAPVIVTVPATSTPVPTPGTMPSPTPNTIPSASPVTPTAPVTNPVTTPTNPGAQPVTNPVTTPAQGLPVTPPAANPTPISTPTPGTSNGPGISGQSWCVAKSGLTETALQSALDYACGMGGADCSAIQQSGPCYNPNTIQNHASVAFNSYYQKNPAPTSCDFGGNAVLTNQNPSSGSCVYPSSTSPSSTSSSSSSSSGTSSATPNTSSTNGSTSTPPSGSGTPPNLVNSSTYPASGGIGSTSTGIIGANPPADSTSIPSSSRFQASLGCITLLASFVTSATLILGT